jgi:predicted PurR-regulated permease PerM
MNPGDGDPGVDLSWSTATRVIVTALIIVSIVALLVFALPIFQTLVVAGLLAYLLNPLVEAFIRRWRMKRSWAAVLVYALFLLVLSAIPAIAGGLAYLGFDRWGEQLGPALNEWKSYLSRPVVILGFDLSPRLLVDNLGQALGNAFSNLSGGSFQLISGFTTNILLALLALVSLYYLLKDGIYLKPWFIRLFIPKYQPEIHRLVDELDEVWRLFLRVQVLIFFILAVLMVLGAGLVIWLYQLGLIPFSTLGLIAMLVLVYALVQQVDNLWLRPQLLGHQMRLHPGIVFVGLVGGLAMGGILGALIVVPAIASVKIISRYLSGKLYTQTTADLQTGAVSSADEETEISS